MDVQYPNYNARMGEGIKNTPALVIISVALLLAGWIMSPNRW